MNILFAKYNGRITTKSNIASYEACSIIELLELNNNVDVIQKICSKDPVRSNYIDIFSENIDFEKYDSLFLLNGSKNFFGGVVPPEMKKLYEIVNNFKKDVYFIYTDPDLNPHSSERHGLVFNKQFNILTQCKNIKAVEEHLKSKNVNFKSVKYVPFEKMCFNQKEYSPSDNRDIDLFYCGTFRSGRRAKAMKKYFCNLPEDINCLLSGPIKREDLGPNAPNIIGFAENHDAYFEDLKKSKCTLAIFDPLYIKLDDMAQRVAESILAGCITFIDGDFNNGKNTLFSDESLNKFLFINSQEDLIKKIRWIKSNNEKIKQITDMQYNCYKVDWNKGQ